MLFKLYVPLFAGKKPAYFAKQQVFTSPEFAGAICSKDFKMMAGFAVSQPGNFADVGSQQSVVVPEIDIEKKLF